MIMPQTVSDAARFSGQSRSRRNELFGAIELRLLHLTDGAGVVAFPRVRYTSREGVITWHQRRTRTRSLNCRRGSPPRGRALRPLPSQFTPADAFHRVESYGATV